MRPHKCSECDDELDPETSDFYDEMGWDIQIVCSRCAAIDAAESAKNAERRADRE